MSTNQLFYKIFTGSLIAVLIGTVAFVLFYPKPTIPRGPYRTRITLASPREIIPNETVTINGTLEYHEDPWEPLPNQDVNLYYAEVESEEWNLIGTATTNTDGQFEYVWTTVTVPLGEYILKVPYPGNERYRPCEATTSPKGLLVIPETQFGSIATLTCMLIALIVIGRRNLRSIAED